MDSLRWVVLTVSCGCLALAQYKTSTPENRRPVVVLEGKDELPTGNSLAGVWMASGSETDDKGAPKRYAGPVLVARSSKQTYFVRWMIADYQEANGIGIRVGDVLSVGWTAGKLRGVHVMKIAPNGKSAEGCWATVGDWRKNKERWEFLREVPKE